LRSLAETTGVDITSLLSPVGAGGNGKPAGAGVTVIGAPTLGGAR
jgi:hypothetical protein